MDGLKIELYIELTIEDQRHPVSNQKFEIQTTERL